MESGEGGHEVEGVGGDRCSGDESKTQDDDPRMRPDRGPLWMGCKGMFDMMQGLGQTAAQDESERQSESAQQKRHTPSPMLEASGSQRCGQGDAHEAAGYLRQILAGALPGAIEATPMGR